MSSRRDFLFGTASLLAGTAARAKPSHERLTELSAAEAITRMRGGDFSAEEYSRALLERCMSAKSLNAFITLEPEQVLRDARAADKLRAKGGAESTGVLHGLPVPIKDCVNTRDYPTTAGTDALRHFRPAADAPLVTQLRAAGAIVLGKTNLHELSYGWTSNNHAYGAVHNPYDPTRIPGGSSGGTGAAVAAHMAPLGVAADTEGSIRVPAALCGIVGFRPTTGRYATQGLAPITAVFDQVGPHARTIHDIVLFDSVIAAERGAVAIPPPKDIRLATCRSYFFAGVDPEIARITEAALERLQAAGATIIDTELPGLAELLKSITDQVQYHDTRPALTRYLAQYDAGVTFDDLVARASPDIRSVFAQYVLPGGSDVVSDADYQRAVNVELPRLHALFRDAFARTGAAAFVFPTTLAPAPRIGEETTIEVGGRNISFDEAMSRNIAPASTAGLPGLVMPVGLTASGLPVSLEFDGPSGSDRSLLGVGMALEHLLGKGPPPPS
jgi:mandelamide amidase